ncbi:MAG TPA: cell division protein FtsZ [Candidatus Babeliaceae bacterium]|nr:cell division protein FtsZ [Candidatus Babeliaceae bacterium]
MIEFEQEYLATQIPVARAKVLGVGGAGTNTVNEMLKEDYSNVDFIVANTDAQVLLKSDAPLKIQLGSKSTRGLGAGANPEIGKRAAEEDLDKIREYLSDADVVFLTAGLGGGTGSGALPVIARTLKERGILSIAVVTMPFTFEGKRRMNIANNALEALRKEIDTLIVIPNQKLLQIADQQVSLVNAFGIINQLINKFVRAIADILGKPGHINVDFADLTAITRNMGFAVMGIGQANGPTRAQDAAHQATQSPLLENFNIKGAKGILLNITGNSKLGLHEVSAASEVIYQQAHEDANIIIGSVIDESYGDEITVTLIATGLSHQKENLDANQVNVTPTFRDSTVLRSPTVSLEPRLEQSSINSGELEVPAILRRYHREKESFQKS